MDKAKDAAYRERAAAELERIKADIHVLEARLQEKKADARLALADRVNELHQKQRQVETRLQELQARSGDAWNDARQSLESAWNELKTGLQSAKDEFTSS